MIKRFLGLVCFAALCGLAGCASAPIKGTLTTYSINGVPYVPLVELCSRYGMGLDYDAYSHTAALRKNSHLVKLRVHDTMVLVNGRAQQLSNPVELYHGSLAVPLSFKDTLLEPLLRSISPSRGKPFSETRFKKIVVDAGHGGKDPGTIGKTGTREKDVNLDVAKRVVRLLQDQGAQVVMTRSSDVFIPLAQRVQIANTAKANLFLSIHSNANRVRSLNGFECYYVSPATSDMRRAVSAAKVGMPHMDRDSMVEQSTNLKTILWDMAFAAHRAESIDIGKGICRIVDHNLESKILGVKGANYYVLKGAQMPAVLVEIGFLSNANEERQLKNSFYRQQVAESLVQGVQEYASAYPSVEASQ